MHVDISVTNHQRSGWSQLVGVHQLVEHPGLGFPAFTMLLIDRTPLGGMMGTVLNGIDVSAVLTQLLLHHFVEAAHLLLSEVTAGDARLIGGHHRAHPALVEHAYEINGTGYPSNVLGTNRKMQVLDEHSVSIEDHPLQ